MHVRLTWLCAAFLAIGCPGAGPEPDGGHPPHDAGIDSDAGVEADAGLGADGGLDMDAGADPDAGLEPDAGPRECDEGTQRSCGSSIGECRPGQQLCVRGAWAPCFGDVKPTARRCEAADRDCDGTADWLQAPCACRDGDNRSCGSTAGVCRPGFESCADGGWLPCSGIADNGLRPPTAVACYRDLAGATLCSDPNPGVVRPMTSVALDGTQSSDPDGQAFTHQWTLASAPSGSTATIGNPTSAQPTLTGAAAGDYQVCLTVRDTTLCSSMQSCVTVHVVNP